MRIGDLIRVAIDDVAFGGDGVARVSDMVVFVPFTVDGDEAEIKITEIRQRYARGRLVRIIMPSPYRVLQVCPYFTRCGGCRMQHVAYSHQLALKQRQVAEIFKRIADIFPLPIRPIIPSSAPFGWRGKAEFHLGDAGCGSRQMGLMALGSHNIIDVERCRIAEESINRKYFILRDMFRSGALRIFGNRQVIWSDEPDSPPTEVFTRTGTPPDVTRIVRGRRFTVPGRGFFQANTALIGKFVDLVVETANLSGGEVVIDAYGGSGLFSVFLASKASRLFGIEGDKQAVRCALINLKRSGFPQVEFLHGDVADTLKKGFVLQSRRVDVVVLDPPRDGFGRGVLEALIALRPERIVYVSCNPTTQARDIRRLTGSGYGLNLLQPIDMFPQTAHIEIVALLTRTSG